MYSLLDLAIWRNSVLRSCGFGGMGWMLMENGLSWLNKWIGMFSDVIMWKASIIAVCAGSSVVITIPRQGGIDCSLGLVLEWTSLGEMKFAVWHLLLGGGKSLGSRLWRWRITARWKVYPRCRLLSVFVFCLSPNINLGCRPSITSTNFSFMALRVGIVMDRCCARGVMLLSCLYVGFGRRSWSDMRVCIMM